MIHVQPPVVRGNNDGLFVMVEGMTPDRLIRPLFLRRYEFYPTVSSGRYTSDGETLTEVVRHLKEAGVLS